MKVSTKGRYALRLMISIAEKGEGSVTTLREVSEEQSISVKYLEQLVSALTCAGLLQGHRGAHGGYSLARPAGEITAGDVIRALYSIGKNVPEDVRILGFDDAPESRISRPALSTVHIHTQVMAFSAVHLLMSRIEEPSLDYRTMHTQTDLIYRESTKFDGRSES